METAVMLLILFAAVILFAAERFSVDVVAILLLGALLVSGIITPAEGLSGFGSPATITVAAMFVLSAGLNSTGALAVLGQRLIRHGSNETWLLLLVILGTAAVSPFINNTAAVAVFIPLVLSASASRKVPASRLLIPLSFASQFGGVCTLVGTSTNLLVNTIAAEHGLPTFKMFEFLELGLVMVGAGLVYFMVLGRWMLPRRSPGELTRRYGLGEYITELRVLRNSQLVGRSVMDARLADQHDVRVIEILRGDRRIWSPLYEPLQVGDILLVRGSVKDLFKLKNSVGLELEAQFKLQDQRLGGRDTELVEAVVAPRSRMVGRTLRGVDFHWRYKAVVLAIHRRGHVFREKLTQVRMRSGDALLLLGPKEDIARLRADDDFVLLESRRDVTLNRRKAPVALGIVTAVVLLAALGVMPIVVSALLGCAAMVLAGCLRADDVYRAVDWKVVVLLGGVLPLGLGLENSGVADGIVDYAFGLAGHIGPVFMLGVVYVLTALLTAFMSNNAAAAVLAPVAISTAFKLGVDPKPFLVAVTFAASTCFATPVGYQTNTMVYTAGGYRFSDFLKVGVPLNLLFCALAMYFIPKFWPL